MRVDTPRLLFAFFSVAILWGCTSDNRATLPDADFFVVDGQPFLLRVGDTAGVQTTSAIVLVRFDDVLSDSRCPEGVSCVTAGFATVSLAVQTSLAIREIDVEVPPEGTVEVVVEEVTIDILQLRPPAQEGVTIELLDYQMALRVRQTTSIEVPQP